MDTGDFGVSEGRFGVTGKGGSAGGRRRRRWWIAGAIWLVGALGVYLLHGWLLDEIVRGAALRGVSLSACRLDLGISTIGLDGCDFSMRPDGRVFSAALRDVAMSGSVARVEVELDGLEPSLLRVRGARATLRGEPRLAELLGSSGSVPGVDLPVYVAESALSWQVEADKPAVVQLSDIAYDAGVGRLLARFEVVRRGHGQLSLGPEGVEVTLGDPAHPEVRLIVRVLPKAGRAEASLDLRRVPLRTLEGPWLQMTDTLRPIELEGRVFATVPLGLSMEVPTGDLHLTLHGLQFPVPRELEGIVHQSPPKLSGKFTLSRSFNRASITELSFLTGELAMQGGAELALQGRGVSIQARANGPLACRAIAESAATAHADSALGRLAGSFARRALSGSVEVVAAIEGHTSDLEHARVFTTVGVGCGLAPLPIALGVSTQVLERLPIDVLESLPRFEPSVALPKPRPGRPRAALPGFDLAPAPRSSP
jgi:hypothetical protein